jgi:cell fate (sporulation/competence/biofilm development) regulator YlbF (YheA/YmcA/DUF963 family)
MKPFLIDEAHRLEHAILDLAKYVCFIKDFQRCHTGQNVKELFG